MLYTSTIDKAEYGSEELFEPPPNAAISPLDDDASV
jgi:hypothetical protein